MASKEQATERIKVYSAEDLDALSTELNRQAAEYSRFAGLLRKYGVESLGITNQPTLELGLNNIRSHLGAAFIAVNDVVGKSRVKEPPGDAPTDQEADSAGESAFGDKRKVAEPPPSSKKKNQK